MKNVKNMKKVIAAAILMTGFAVNANAQTEANASTTAILVSPLKIVKTTDMHFGIVAASSDQASTITLDYADGVTPANGSAIIDDADAKTGVFTVTGAPDESISIALSADNLLLIDGTNPDLTVNGITCQQGTTNTLDNGGSLILKVKGVLQLPLNAAGGTYTNADDLEITVAYN